MNDHQGWTPEDYREEIAKDASNVLWRDLTEEESTALFSIKSMDRLAHYYYEIWMCANKREVAELLQTLIREVDIAH